MAAVIAGGKRAAPIAPPPRPQGDFQPRHQPLREGDPDPKLLAYQYLQTLPKLAEGEANKLWIIPSELTEALKNIGDGFFTPGGKTPTK